MRVQASGFYSLDPDSADAGRAAAASIRSAFGATPLRAMMIYCTMNHDQPAVLQAAQDELGPDVPLFGCSVQGVATDTGLSEDGYVVGAMGFGGTALRCAVAAQSDIQIASHEKGQHLARQLKAELRAEPKLVVVLYDPLCGCDIEALLSGIRTEIECPVIGGGAGQPFGAPTRTFQYWGGQVVSRGVVALALDGPFVPEIGLCHGSSPTGAAVTVTKSHANHLQEIGGRSALESLREAIGCAAGEEVTQQHLASWAIGIERTFTEDGVERRAHMIRGAFGFDADGAVILQTAVPEGTTVMFHHRTIDDVLAGTRVMGGAMRARLDGREPWAVLGFECAARTYPFLGPDHTHQEHDELRAAIAPRAPWLGMMAWGEIAPLGGRFAFHNYSYPVVVLTEQAP